MSSWGSQISTRATGCRIAAAGAGIPRSGWYEAGMNDRIRILVVDDDEDIRLLLRELLERAGYAVDEATTAARRSAPFVTPPALVILDVTMPGLDGYQTLERIRDLSDVPVLMLTARTQELEKVRGLSRWRRRLRREAVRPPGAARPRPGAASPLRRQPRWSRPTPTTSSRSTTPSGA